MWSFWLRLAKHSLLLENTGLVLACEDAGYSQRETSWLKDIRSRLWPGTITAWLDNSDVKERESKHDSAPDTPWVLCALWISWAIKLCQLSLCWHNLDRLYFRMGSLVQAFTRRKFVDPNALTSTQLNRCLSIFDLTFIGTGTTIGAGLFVLAGDVARNSTGPSIVISFLIAGIASVLSGLCYAEFGARVPKAGSAYVYSYVAIGELCALIIGWSLTLEYLIGSASVGKATSLYVDSLFHEGIKNFTISTIGKIHAAGIAEYPDLMAVLIILVTTIILITGIKKSSWSMTLFTGITLFVILFIVCVGAFYAEPKNWSNDFMPYGMSGVMTGAATCFYAFVGFDVIATTGEEARNPSRAIPISIILTLSE